MKLADFKAVLEDAKEDPTPLVRLARKAGVHYRLDNQALDRLAEALAAIEVAGRANLDVLDVVGLLDQVDAATLTTLKDAHNPDGAPEGRLLKVLVAFRNLVSKDPARVARMEQVNYTPSDAITKLQGREDLDQEAVKALAACGE